jgi:hypothetical protein
MGIVSGPISRSSLAETLPENDDPAKRAGTRGDFSLGKHRRSLKFACDR